MRKIEITLAKDYAPSWTIVEAVRELFQNAIDQDAQGHKMHWNYNAATEMLSITNVDTALPTQSLLLGGTTKANNEDSIGKYGEGYKLAALVLTRCGKRIAFRNYKAAENWSVRFIKSKRFDAEVLGFFIEYDENAYMHNPDLVIEVCGITNQEWEEQIVPSNLWLQEDLEIIAETPHGRILSKDHAHQVYVNGLFVCSYEKYVYGYDFKPASIRLDRDRKLVSDYDLQYLASKMWLHTDLAEIVAELTASDAADVGHVNGAHWDSHTRQDTYKQASHIAAASFIAEHGTDAVPVAYQSDADNVPKGYRPVIVPYNHAFLIKQSDLYIEPVEAPGDKLSARFMDWYENDGSHDEFIELVKELREIE